MDGEIYVDGSANLTGQSAKNQESILVTRVRQVLDDALATFGEVWSEASEIPFESLLELRERSRSSTSRRSASVSVGRE